MSLIFKVNNGTRMIQHEIKRGIIALGVTFLLQFSSQTSYSQGTWTMTGNKDRYVLETDSSRLYEGQPVVFLRSVDTVEKGYGGTRKILSAIPYIGKRVRMSGYLRTGDVMKWVGFWLRIDGGELSAPMVFDNMNDRAISGTTEWKKYEIVLDVPDGATNFFYGAVLSGPGRIWYSGIKFEVVGNEVPVTRTKL